MVAEAHMRNMIATLLVAVSVLFVGWMVWQALAGLIAQAVTGLGL
jgi:hypothetical protein